MLKKLYTINSDLKEVNQLIDKVLVDIKPHFRDDEIKECLIAIYELLINAIEHGNLNITYEMKKHWIREKVYEENVNALAKKFKNKKVSLSLSIENDSLIIIVTDEGFGFNVKTQTKKLADDNILRENGRGIIIVKHFFDTLVYNEKGNQVTIVKKIKKLD